MPDNLEKTLTAEDFEGILLSDFRTPEMIQRYFCAELKNYMKKNNITPENLAKIMRINQEYLSEVLDGKEEVPYEFASHAVLSIYGPFLDEFLPINPLVTSRESQNTFRRTEDIDCDKRVSVPGMEVMNRLVNYAFPTRSLPEEFFGG